MPKRRRSSNDTRYRIEKTRQRRALREVHDAADEVPGEAADQEMPPDAAANEVPGEAADQEMRQDMQRSGKCIRMTDDPMIELIL